MQEQGGTAGSGGAARRVTGRLAMVSTALLLLVVGGEAAFNLRDGGAFPHVNFYAPDPALGVRLEPHASMRLAFNGNPVTTIRTNALGFRGGEWEAPQAGGSGEIIVVGDSQVFGLGVEEEQTASAVLAARLSAGAGGAQPVRNAGVPTYGLPEYLAVLEEQLRARRPAAAVLVLNQSNDWFEYARPNRERHAVWDGWAVHVETMPASITEFPGRRWIYSQSHLFFALRRAWHSEWIDRPVEGLPSQGGIEDLVGDSAASEQAFQEKLKAHLARVAEEEARYEDQLTLTAKRRARQEDLLISASWVLSLEQDDDLLIQAAIRQAHPGDIVRDLNAEEDRSVKVTAAMLKRGVELRRSLPERMKAWVEAHPKEQAARDIAKILEAMAPPPAPELSAPPGRESALAPQIAAFAALCKEYGARAVLVTLPLDVVVDRQEWKKYGEDPAQMPDMAETEVLLLEAREVAARLGVTPVDPMALLRAAQPGAFLYGDIHLSVTGQAALAQAIDEQVFAPVSTPVSTP